MENLDTHVSLPLVFQEETGTPILRSYGDSRNDGMRDLFEQMSRQTRTNRPGHPCSTGVPGSFPGSFPDSAGTWVSRFARFQVRSRFVFMDVDGWGHPSSMPEGWFGDLRERGEPVLRAAGLHLLTSCYTSYFNK